MNKRTTRRRAMIAALAGGVTLGASRSTRVGSTAGDDQSAAAPLPRTSSDMPLAIADVTVIDATGAEPVPHMTVTGEGARIVSIQPAREASPSGQTRIVDGTGRFLIPGLWDAHIHTFVFPWQPETYFPLLIANGVTGIRDMGGALPADAIDDIRAAVAAGQQIGPRIVAGLMVDGPTPVWPFAIRAGTAEEGREAVGAVATAGADFVKVYTLLPREAFLALAEAARESGLPFAGHVPIAVTAVEASAAGQRTVEHYSDSLLPYCSTAGDDVLAELRAAALGPDPVQTYAATFFAALPRLIASVDPDKIERLAQTFAVNQTWFTPTLIIGHNAALAGNSAQIADPRMRLLPPEVVAAWIPPEDGAAARSPVDPAIARRSLDIGAAITRAMRQAGAPLLAGTDLGLPFVYPGFSLHDELVLLVRAGLTPGEALQAATRNPARVVGRGDELGTVEVGKLADLVLLEADPFADISNTTRIAAVIVNGQPLEQPELGRLLRAAEYAATPTVSTIS